MTDKFKPDRPIVDQTKLNELCDHLRDQDLIAVDTEFNRTNTYRPQLCLIQIATDKRVACVDTLAELDPKPLLKTMTSGADLCVFHAAKQDLEAFYLTYGVLPQPIFDTQIAAALLGYPPQVGYASLVKDLINVDLDKGATRTDWSRRPLTSTQLLYAANDVLYLPEMHGILRQKLSAVGRYDWVLQDSAALLDKNLYMPPIDEAWRRISSIRFLPPPTQARARRLAAWREVRARTVDRPRQWILSDKAILSLATEDPQNEATLNRVPDLPPAIVRKQGQQILTEIVQANEDVSRGVASFQQHSKPTPPDPRILQKLGSIVKTTAEALGFAPEILATRKELGALMKEKTDLRVLTGWRKKIIGDALLKAL
jgi:ribonuclease D